MSDKKWKNCSEKLDKYRIECYPFHKGGRIALLQRSNTVFLCPGRAAPAAEQNRQVKT